MEGRVEFRPEIHEPSAKQEAGLEATLRVKHIWAVGPSEAWVAELELKAAESQASLTSLLTSQQLDLTMNRQ